MSSRQRSSLRRYATWSHRDRTARNVASRASSAIGERSKETNPCAPPDRPGGSPTGPGKRFGYQERTVYTLHAAVPEIGVTIAGFRLDKPTPDHVSLHHDLHPVFTRCGKDGSMRL